MTQAEALSFFVYWFAGASVGVILFGISACLYAWIKDKRDRKRYERRLKEIDHEWAMAGMREDLTDIINEIAPTETPLYDMRKSKKK